MFRTDQIVTSTQLIRHFRALARRIEKTHEPLLISQRNSQFLVILEAGIFENLLVAQYQPDFDYTIPGAKVD